MGVSREGTVFRQTLVDTGRYDRSIQAATIVRVRRSLNLAINMALVQRATWSQRGGGVRSAGELAGISPGEGEARQRVTFRRHLD
jgi:hypothetical protein